MHQSSNRVIITRTVIGKSWFLLRIKQINFNRRKENPKFNKENTKKMGNISNISSQN